MVGSLITAVHPRIIDWSYSYWGGAVAAMGGALVFGASTRLLKRPTVLRSVLFALGLVILANTRPFEGVVVASPFCIAMLWFAFTNKRYHISRTLRVVALPFVTVMLIGATLTLLYNYRVTGHALQMPHQLHASQYCVSPPFLFQTARTIPTYRHQEIETFHTSLAIGFPFQWYTYSRTREGLIRTSIGKLVRLYLGYVGPVLTLALLSLPWIIRRHSFRVVFTSLLCFVVAYETETFAQLHYAAPIFPLVALVCIAAMRQTFNSLKGFSLNLEKIYVGVIMLLFVTMSVMTTYSYTSGLKWNHTREKIIHTFSKTSNDHLIFVQYGSQHNPHFEWVYNDANIDGSQVVWARDISLTANTQLRAYFKDRVHWLLLVQNERSVLRKLKPAKLDLSSLSVDLEAEEPVFGTRQ